VAKDPPGGALLIKAHANAQRKNRPSKCRSADLGSTSKIQNPPPNFLLSGTAFRQLAFSQQTGVLFRPDPPPSIFLSIFSFLHPGIAQRRRRICISGFQPFRISDFTQPVLPSDSQAFSSLTHVRTSLQKHR
jgi:hypothetical protein